MDHETDVEHLFSWLQTPELRYREFASVREITDTIIPVSERPSAVLAQLPPGETPSQPVAGTDPEESFVRSEASIHDPATIAPTSSAEFGAPVAPTRAEDSFAVAPPEANDPYRPEFAEPVAPPAIAHPAPPPVTSAVESDEPPPVPPHVVPPATAGGALLGGAYREDSADQHGTEDPPSAAPPSGADPEPDGTRSLDALFGRLGGGRDRLPDPRDRMKHIPGLTPPRGRPR